MFWYARVLSWRHSAVTGAQTGAAMTRASIVVRIVHGDVMICTVSHEIHKTNSCFVLESID